MRLLNRGGKVIATAFAQSTGGMAALGEFTTTMKVKTPPRAGTPLTLQVFGDNPGPGPGPGSDLREVEVLMFPKLTGWLLYRVESGDTLTGIHLQRRRPCGAELPISAFDPKRHWWPAAKSPSWTTIAKC